MINLLNITYSVVNNLSFLERIIPLTIVYTIITIIFLYKEKIKESKRINNTILYSSTILLTIIFIINLFKNLSRNLPTLDFLSISILLALILLISKNKLILHLNFLTGILGSLIHLLVNNPEYSFTKIEYYVFIIGYSLIMIVVLYFLIVNDFAPSLKHSLISFAILQMSLVLIFTINALFKTNFLYLTVGKNIAPSTHFFTKLGKWPWNIIYLDIILISFMFIWYAITLIFFNSVKEEDDLVISKSTYITTRKKDRFSR